MFFVMALLLKFIIQLRFPKNVSVYCMKTCFMSNGAYFLLPKNKPVERYLFALFFVHNMNILQ